MLSSSHTINDVRAKLSNPYTFYNFASDDEFNSVIESTCDDVYRLYFLPKYGASGYSIIQAKNKVGLNTTETYLYWAEVFMTCHMFLKDRTAVDGQLQNSNDETLTVEGYTHKIGSGGSGGASQGDYSLRSYWAKAYKYFKLGGIDIAQIERTCTIFGSSEEYEEDIVLDIIE